MALQEVLQPEVLLREVVLREALRQQVERLGLSTELRSVQPALSRPARPAVPAVLHRECPACPFAAAAPMALAWGLPAAGPRVVRLTAEQVVLRSEPGEQGVLAVPRREAQRVAAAQPLAAQAELAVSGAEAVLQPAAREAVSGAEAELQPAAREAVQDAAAELQPAARAAVSGAVVELQPVAGAAVPDAGAVRLRAAGVAAPDAEEAPLRGVEAEVPDAAGAPLRGVEAEVPDAGVPQRVARAGPGVLLLAAVWAGLLSTRLQGRPLAPSAPAQSAHARGQLRTAQP